MAIKENKLNLFVRMRKYVDIVVEFISANWQIQFNFSNVTLYEFIIRSNNNGAIDVKMDGSCLYKAWSYKKKKYRNIS